MVLKAYKTRGNTYVVGDKHSVWAKGFKTREKALAYIKKKKGKTPYLNMDGKVAWY